MILEVVATHLTDAKIAARNGADRLELVQSMAEDGLTPSYGLIDEVVRAVQIPVNVIVRPHGHSFCYDDDDIQTMIKDIQMIKQLGATGIVIGALTPNGEIDVEAVQRLLAVAEGLDVTFHRAFDYARDQEEALHVLAEFPQISRILTSGGQQKAPQATDKIGKLLTQANETHLTLIAGHGLALDSLATFIDTIPIQEVHFGSGVRVNSAFNEPIDGDKIQKVKKILTKRN